MEVVRCIHSPHNKTCVRVDITSWIVWLSVIVIMVEAALLSGRTLDLAYHWIREWMKRNLIDFSKNNPQLKVVTSVVPNRHPILIAEYSICSSFVFISRKWFITSGMCEEYVTEGYLGTCRLSFVFVRIGYGYEKYKRSKSGKGISGGLYKNPILPRHVWWFLERGVHSGQACTKLVYL